MAQSTEIEGYDCHCCRQECPDVPGFAETGTCGHALAKSSFDSSVQASIPDVAEKMLWAVEIQPVVKTANVTEERQCTDPPNAGEWIWRDIVTKAGVYEHLTKSVDGGGSCITTTTCGGTDTDDREERVDACGDPADNTLDVDDSTSGTWVYNAGAGQCELTLTGLDIDSNPISQGPLTTHGYAIGAGATVGYTVDLTGTQVVQTRARSWDETDGDRYYVGSDAADFGYTGPVDFEYRVTVPTDATIKYMAVEWDVIFTDKDDVETTVSSESIEWEDGDPSREFSYSESYTDFGAYRIANVRYRCSTVAHWQTLADPIDTAS